MARRPPGEVLTHCWNQGSESQSFVSLVLFFGDKRRVYNRSLTARVIHMEDEGLKTHFWVGNHSREIEIDGKPIVLFRCPVCERDLSPASQIGEQRIGTFRIMYLLDSVAQQWVSAPCPGPPPASPLESAIGPAPEVDRIRRPAPGRHRVNRKA